MEKPEKAFEVFEKMIARGFSFLFFSFLFFLFSTLFSFLSFLIYLFYLFSGITPDIRLINILLHMCPLFHNSIQKAQRLMAIIKEKREEKTGEEREEEKGIYPDRKTLDALLRIGFGWESRARGRREGESEGEKSGKRDEERGGRKRMGFELAEEFYSWYCQMNGKEFISFADCDNFRGSIFSSIPSLFSLLFLLLFLRLFLLSSLSTFVSLIPFPFPDISTLSLFLLAENCPPSLSPKFTKEILFRLIEEEEFFSYLKVRRFLDLLTKVFFSLFSLLFSFLPPPITTIK